MKPHRVCQIFERISVKSCVKVGMEIGVQISVEVSWISRCSSSSICVWYEPGEL